MRIRYADSMTFEVIMAYLLDCVPDGVDKREGSIIYDALAPAAAGLESAYMELDVVMDETFVDTASMEGLQKRAEERGVPIKTATTSTVRGTFVPAILEIPLNSRFNCDDQNFIVTEKASDGVYKLVAETPGTAGNLYFGALLPIDYIQGLESAQIVDLLIPGEDGDDTESLRERYFESVGATAFGGNQADYREKVNFLNGVGGVKVYPVWNGGGTVRISIITSQHTVPSTELINQVQTALDPTQKQGEGLGLAPIGHVVTVTGATTTTINVASHIALAAGWSWADAESLIRQAVTGYFTTLAEDWANQLFLVVRISQIENVIFNLACVIDVADTTINGESKNKQLGTDEIPQLGTLVNV